MASGNLSSIIDTLSDQLSNTDTEWVNFVNDHLNLIKEHCSIVVIDDAMRDRFHYKFDHFIREQNCSQNISWIAYLVNDLTMYEDFILQPTILIPNVSYIIDLYRTYRTSKNAD